MALRVFWSGLFIWMVSILGSACKPLPPKLASETPKKQFIIRSLEIADRRDGQLLWKGEAERADGDLVAIDVKNIALERLAQKAGEKKLYIAAPTGVLHLDQDTAEFYELQIRGERGEVLAAKSAYYDGLSNTLKVIGPLELTSQDLLMVQAKEALMDLSTNNITIAGPVSGKIYKHYRHP